MNPSRPSYHYAYDSASRLISQTDPMGQTKKINYTIDNLTQGYNYQNAINTTPSVVFNYDSLHPRLINMQDGTGATGFKYVPAGVQGAGQLAEEDSPDGGSATIKNSYDELGRLSTRQLGTSTESLTYDTLGRVTQDQSALGTFQYSYLGQTNQVTNEVLQGGNWQTVNTYGTNAQDRQLQSISHQAPLSPFQQFIHWLMSCFSSAPTSTSATPTITYETGPEQQILARTDEQGKQSYGYDADQRLTTVTLATQSSGSHTPHNEHGDFMSDQNPGRGLGRDNNDQHHGGGSSLLSTNYTYDPANNLTMVQKGITSTAFTMGADNDVQSKNNIGWFYDANGNVLDDGRNSYLWDAENRLTQITNKTSGQVSQFKYDGLSRRTAIIEKTSATATPQETHYLWCGSKPCESHTPSGQSLLQLFAQGEIVVGSAAPHYYALDHLGSVVQVVDANGATQGTQQYDAYGMVTQTSGIKPTFGYAGMFQHDPSGLNLTWFRAYDPTSARWLSKDPIAEAGGLNLYGYVGGSPIGYVDIIGLATQIQGGVSATAILSAFGVSGGFNVGVNIDGMNSTLYIQDQINYGVGVGLALGAGFNGGVAHGSSPTTGFDNPYYAELDVGPYSTSATITDCGVVGFGGSRGAVRLGVGGGGGTFAGGAIVSTAVTPTLGDALKLFGF